MDIENLQAQLAENNEALSGKHISIEIKTKEQVTQLIQLLSNEKLQMGSLDIDIDAQSSNYFISRFNQMSTTPKITKLSLPGVTLTHEGWEIFFATLQKVKSLEHLVLEKSNFDFYTNDLRSLGNYLASNPLLNKINLSNDQKQGDVALQFGPNAKELLGYLESNTNLVAIEYGNRLPKLSEEIQRKLELNAMNTAQATLEKLITKSIDTSLLEGTEGNSKTTRDDTISFDLKCLDTELAKFHKSLTLAKKNENFSSAQKEKIASMDKYYVSQFYLLDALEKMYQQELTASTHDKPILHKLREDFLKEWQTVAKLDNATEKNLKMERLMASMIQSCEEATGKIQDKTNFASIKNTLLILSAILTAGISLGIYAAATKQSRAERGSFFFQNNESGNELSKESIAAVKESVEKVQTGIKRTP